MTVDRVRDPIVPVRLARKQALLAITGTELTCCAKFVLVLGC
jgi:hypothetical protein